MPERLLQQRIFPFDGSLDSTKHPLLISAKDIVDVDNIIYTTYSTKKKRPGTDYLFERKIIGNRKILQGVDYWRLGTQYIILWNGRFIYAVDPVTGIENNITGPSVLPTDEAVTFLIFQGLLIIFFHDGVTPIKYWNGSGAIQNLTATGTPGRFGRVFLNSLWIPDEASPGTLLKSKTGDPTDFTTGDSTSFHLDVNDSLPELTAIFPPYSESLYITKRYDIYKITPYYSAGTLYYSQTHIISNDIGCISHNSAISVENYIMFPSDRGFHLLSTSDNVSGIETEFISSPIQPTWFEQTNFSRAKYMNAIYSPEFNSYILLYPESSRLFCNSAWGFSLSAKKWYRWSDFNHSCIFRYLDNSNKKFTTLCGSNNSELGVLSSDYKTDYGQPFDIYIRTGLIAPSGYPNDRFMFEMLTVLFVPQESGTFSVTYKIDSRIIETLEFSMVSEEEGETLGVDWVLAQSYLGGVPMLLMDTRTLVGQGCFYELIIQHTPTKNTEEDFEILGFLVDVDTVTKVTGRISG